MKRTYQRYINELDDRKITLISGPRQCGKTTLSMMLSENNEYISFDEEEGREITLEKSWDRKKNQIIFDELHKMKNWKVWLKGIYDTEGIPPKLCVTGSARLDTFRKVGDSMAGRYLSYRLHPFDIRELYQLDNKININTSLDRLMEVSGFPEPYLEGSKSFYNRWKRTHLDIILRQDLISTEDIKDLKSLELLIQLLTKRVGSPISYSSLSRDLQCSDKTIKRWLGILEDMFIVFKITPFHRNIARSNTKQPKYYFYDIARVKDEGARLENLVACSLFKECQFRQDCLGEEFELFYLAKNGGMEIDFAIVENDEIKHAIEVKLSDDKLSKNFSKFQKDIPNASFIQLVKNLKREKTFPSGEEVRSVGQWLCQW